MVNLRSVINEWSPISYQQADDKFWNFWTNEVWRYFFEYDSSEAGNFIEEGVLNCLNTKCHVQVSYTYYVQVMRHEAIFEEKKWSWASSNKLKL